MRGGVLMKRQRTYSKPNMANLHGRVGREVLRAIRNTPPADFTNLEKGVQECEKRLRAMEKNGTAI